MVFTWENALTILPRGFCVLFFDLCTNAGPSRLFPSGFKMGWPEKEELSSLTRSSFNTGQMDEPFNFFAVTLTDVGFLFPAPFQDRATGVS